MYKKNNLEKMRSNSKRFLSKIKEVNEFKCNCLSKLKVRNAFKKCE